MRTKTLIGLAVVLFTLATALTTVGVRDAHADDVPKWNDIAGELILQMDYPQSIIPSVPLNLLSRQFSSPTPRPCINVWHRDGAETVKMRLCFVVEGGGTPIGLNRIIEIKSAADSLLTITGNSSTIPDFTFRHMPDASEVTVTTDASGKTEVTGDFNKHKEELAKLFD